MGYLICDKCGGYHELQPGESPEDFSNKCKCGGNLIEKKSLDVNITPVCQECGTENPENATFCANCGNILQENSEVETNIQIDETNTENIRDKWAKKVGLLIVGLFILTIIFGSYSIFNFIFLILAASIYISKSFKLIYGFIVLGFLSGIIQTFGFTFGRSYLIFAGIFTLAFTIAILYQTRKL